ncbi:MAG: stage II sporulation protein M [Candidatus Woesearchaeota archaeon]|nr:stage II sporulation protein M [Candidatus Woesearchaeota archaeon]
MVLESIKIKWVEHRPYIAFLFGFCYTFVGYFIAEIFFKKYVSIAMLFLSTLLVVPSLIKLLEIEEKRESKYGLKNFFIEHKDVVEAYVFLFIGLFLGYVLLGSIISPAEFGNVFKFQKEFLEGQEGLSTNLVKDFMEKPFEPSIGHVIALVQNNVFVCIILFILSFFYGAGAIFLIILNASVFASFIIMVAQYLAKNISSMVLMTSIFSVHMLPEVVGFLLAAISGGVVSKAVMREKISGKGFRNVIEDSLLLLIIGCVLIIIAAFLEVYATTYLFKNFA